MVTPVNGGIWGAQDIVTGNTGTLDTKKVVSFQTNGASIAGGVVAGTQYQLFTFTFGSGQNCNGTFRLFVPGTDPSDPNGAGGNFISFLAIGGIDEVSTNNDPTFKNCVTVLPIKLTNFSAIRKDNNAVLNWKVTNQDANSSHFELERSFNGTDFKNIGRVDVNLSSGLAGSYSFTDLNAAASKTNVIYYRLKMVDKDEKSTLSTIKNIRLTKKSFGVNVYPNPARQFSTVNIDLENESSIILSLTDASGKVLQKTKFSGFKGLNQKQIDLSRFASGSYLLKVNSGNEMQTVSIIKE